MATFPLGVHGRRLLAGLLLLLVLLLVAWRHARRADAPAPLQVAPISPARRSPSAPRPRMLIVDVAGAVRRPGLVRLREGARVADAVAHAGGLARGAVRAGVNLAAPLADGQQVLVPDGGAAGPAGAAGSVAGSAAPTAPTALSSATAEQLDALPGVGPVTAQKIVAYREQHGAFRTVDELDAIPGIGPARIADLQGLVVP